MRHGKEEGHPDPRKGLLNGGQDAPAPWRAEPFPVGEVQFPGHLDPHDRSYTKAELTHNIMPDTLEM